MKQKLGHGPRQIQGDQKVTSPIKIFIDGCNSVQFKCINTHTILLWLYKSPCRSRQVITCLHQSVICLSSAEVQGCLFISAMSVEPYLVPQSYLSWQNKFMDTFPDSPVSNKLTASNLVNHCHGTGNMLYRKCSSQPVVLSGYSLDDISQTLLCSPQVIEKTFSSDWIILWEWT
jgi:hypothetical protein